ncbi:hypothetical protein DF021_32585 [Burkholderia stagnalis]|uniref:Uncharacterized protein n=1 Tax=Burkholderia stagnalis TaxID=1503054 RepID=A0ABX9YEW6_9BURK|nr:hypothetical protein DF158_32655 [Burkholderia stagnalis]RQQ60084.1 hypothetical protein DF137_32510 [Burkholderia stagnalis]RQQ60375.1 hypothetical protein DF139_32625 [Burkholderia stagnalis]RQQ75420.1 hypothetical protein DF138_32015 [Burkholderia stagnalis]RQQ80530.1 hypothetical protein DF134_33000 [Burkholderia stagnalis]
MDPGIPKEPSVAKDYPLEIKNVGGETYIVMSKGHHDVHEFMKQVRADGYDWPLGMPQHVWMRTVPSRDPSVICRYVESSEGARGAFPCTYAWEAYNERRYEAIMAADGSNQP